MDVVLPLPVLRNAVAVDIDHKNNDIYWTDTAEDIIQKASIDGTNLQSIIVDGLETADGIAVDSVGRKVSFFILMLIFEYTREFCRYIGLMVEEIVLKLLN